MHALLDVAEENKTDLDQSHKRRWIHSCLDVEGIFRNLQHRGSDGVDKLDIRICTGRFRGPTVKGCSNMENFPQTRHRHIEPDER